MLDRVFKIVEDNLILIAVFILTITILLMIRDQPLLTDNEGFMYLATGIIITGLVNGIIQKTNTQQQRSNEKVTQTMADALATSAPVPLPSVKPSEVVIKTDQTKVNSNEQPEPSSDRPVVASPRPSWVESSQD